MSEYSDEDYTLTETQCEERCDELRSQLDEANKIIESLGQESDHFCKQADELRSQVARLEGELVNTVRCHTCKGTLIFKRVGKNEIETYHTCNQATLQIANRERELSDQLVEVLRRTEGALYECGCESCEATLQELCAALTNHAAMRATTAAHSSGTDPA